MRVNKYLGLIVRLARWGGGVKSGQNSLVPELIQLALGTSSDKEKYCIRIDSRSGTEIDRLSVVPK